MADFKDDPGETFKKELYAKPDFDRITLGPQRRAVTKWFDDEGDELQKAYDTAKQYAKTQWANTGLKSKGKPAQKIAATRKTTPRKRG